MIQHIDREPTPGKENRKKLTYDDGRVEYAKIEFADDPIVTGTSVNKVFADELLAASGTTGGTGAALTLEQPGFNLADGATVRIKLHTPIAAEATLNVSGTGAKPIVDSKGKPVKAGAVTGAWLTLIYNGTNFILQGEGSEKKQTYGNEKEQISTVEWAMVGCFNPYYTKQKEY